MLRFVEASPCSRALFLTQPPCLIKSANWKRNMTCSLKPEQEAGDAHPGRHSCWRSPTHVRHRAAGAPICYRNRAHCGRTLRSSPTPPTICFTSLRPFVRISVGSDLAEAGNTETGHHQPYPTRPTSACSARFPRPEFDIVKLNSTPIIAFASKRTSDRPASTVSLEELSGPAAGDAGNRFEDAQKLEDFAAAAGVTLKPAIEAEAGRRCGDRRGRCGVGFVSAAEFAGTDVSRRVENRRRRNADGEALICLKERSGGSSCAPSSKLPVRWREVIEAARFRRRLAAPRIARTAF